MDGEAWSRRDRRPKRSRWRSIRALRFSQASNIAEQHLPQDGRSRIRGGPAKKLILVLRLPTVYGEKIVIRPLDRASLTGTVDQLGID